MNTAKDLYQQYKALPQGIQREFKALINEEEIEKLSLLEQIERGLQDVKLIREGKKKALTFADVFDE